jgi:hypothetical protein
MREYANISNYGKEITFDIVSGLWPANADGGDGLSSLRGQD